MSGSENLKETALYDGAENPIIYSRELSPALECTFDLTYFPFDKQTCSIILTVGIEHVNFVRLLALELSFSGEKSLPNFNVLRWNFETLMEGRIVKASVELKRKVAQHLLGIYLPSLFLIIIAQVFF